MGESKSEDEQPTSYDKFAPRPKIRPEVLDKMFGDVARFVREEKQILDELRPHMEVIRKHEDRNLKSKEKPAYEGHDFEEEDFAIMDSFWDEQDKEEQSKSNDKG